MAGSSGQEVMRFSKLEILLLDDNKLEDVSVFAALAGLSRYTLASTVLHNMPFTRNIVNSRKDELPVLPFQFSCLQFDLF